MVSAGALMELSAERVWAELVKALEGREPERFIEALRAWGALPPWFEEFGDVRPVAAPALTMPEQRFAAYVSKLAPGAIETLSARLKAPRAHLRLARWVARHGTELAGWVRVSPEALYRALQEARAFTDDSSMKVGLAVVAALHGVDLSMLPELVAEIRDRHPAAAFAARGLEGPALGRALDEARIEALAEAQRRLTGSPGTE
jgi:tRNA nucleotidyltransferase (CCA-adding enzyme)